MDDIKATATMYDGTRVKGRLTTDHAASSYGQPVFVDEAGQAYDWFGIASITTTEDRRKGGQSTSEAKAEAARANGRKGGRPRKQEADDAKE
jgi:hypothetical protein